MKRTLLLAMTLLFWGSWASAQKKDKAMFKEYEPGYYQNFIMKDVNAVKKNMKRKSVYKHFQMNQTGMKLPNQVKLYKREWSQPVISQGNAGTCWAYSTISFFESEVKRLSGKKVKLSEIYIAYWEYVEKAMGYVRTRGKSHFSQGSEGNAVTRTFKKYGAMPYGVYSGLINGRKFHSHEAMYNEMYTYLKSLKKSNAWNEAQVAATIKSIMNHHIGEPPTAFKVDGKSYTPKTYLTDYLKLIPDDYVEILSYKQEPYWQKVEYKVPDNWWHSEEYYNVPLDVFMTAVKDAITNGYTMSIGGDVSEAGFVRSTQCAVVPTFDIPAEYIDDNARQFRFSNKTTTDDHGMHLVGWLKQADGIWYLIKDSSSGSRNNDPKAAEFGYYFFHENYVKLKMLGFTVHKDALPKVLSKFK